MPELRDVIAKRENKGFVKRSYRPWDLSGEVSNAPENVTTETAETPIENPAPNIPTHKAIKKSPEARNLKLAVTVNKPGNLENTLGNKSEDELENNREQLGNTSGTIREPLENKQGTTWGTDREQLGDALNPDSLRNQIAKLSGIQRNILEFIVEICAAKNSDETGPIETKIIAQYVQASYDSIKTSLKRLIRKAFLNRQPGRTAKGGYINLQMPNDVKEILISLRERQQHQQNPIEWIKSIREQLDNKLGDKNTIYSSNININTTTNSGHHGKLNLPEEWASIDFEPLSNIGFSKTHLKQVADKNSPDVVQESIYHFAYGLEHNPKTQEYSKDGKNPLNVFLGVLRKGQGWFERDYRSPQEMAQEEIVNRKKAERERLKNLEEEAYKLALAEWQEALTKEEVDNIVSSKGGAGDLTPQHVKLSIYFREKVWGDRKKDYGIGG